MIDPLAGELDALFQAAPGAMVEARNALADRLRKAGDKAAAAQIKALKRPAPAAWALNQVHFREPALLARAVEATAEVRSLHARDAVDARALMAAHEAQRSATKAVLDAALSYCQAAGVPSSVAHQRRLLATLQALLTGAGTQSAGRLSEELEPSGFDAIDSVGTLAPRTVASASDRAAPKAATEQTPNIRPAPSTAAAASVLAEQERLAERERLAEQERLAARLAQRERTLREAQAIAHKRRSARQRSEAERDKARDALSAAEQEAQRLRERASEREAEFQAASAAYAEAEQALRAAETEVDSARRERART